MASRLLRLRSGVSRPPWAVRTTPTRLGVYSLPQARGAATAAAEQENPEEPGPRVVLGLDGKPLPPPEILRTDIESPVDELPKDPTLFSSLKGKFAYETLKAITVKPMTHTTMTPVQQAVLSLLPELVDPHPDTAADVSSKKGFDLLVKSKTGTGKTLAFLVPAIEKRVTDVEDSGKRARIEAGLPVDKSSEGQYRRAFARDSIGCLILSPTRELAQQIAIEAAKLSSHHKEFEVKLVVGGESKRFQMKGLMKGRKDIVVATPGRMRDLLGSEPAVPRALARTSMFILDEADTLLDMGFRDDIDYIASFLPAKTERQTFLFSATISPAIKQIANAYLDKGQRFIDTVTDDASPVHAHIPQYGTVLSSAADQIPHVLRLIIHDQLINPARSKIMVFLPTTKTTQLFADVLREMRTHLPARINTKVFAIHSNLSQERRTKVSDEFRHYDQGASILVTSDVSARGVDYPSVSRVIQVGAPSSSEQYIHRVGRTGRAGRSGRGDLVLLPFEGGFIQNQLSHVQMRDVSSEKIEEEVEDLVARFDIAPDMFFKGVEALPMTREMKRDRYGKMPERHDGPVRPYQSPYKPLLESQPELLSQLLKKIDPEVAEPAFTSLLGYYVGRSQDIRSSKERILEGIQEWATQAIQMERPPFLSNTFLARLGFLGGGGGGGRGVMGMRRDRPRPSHFTPERGTSSFGDQGRSSYGGGRGEGFRATSSYGDRGSSYGGRGEGRGSSSYDSGRGSSSYGDRPSSSFRGRSDDGSFGNRDSSSPAPDVGRWREREDHLRTSEGPARVRTAPSYSTGRVKSGGSSPHWAGRGSSASKRKSW